MLKSDIKEFISLILESETNNDFHIVFKFSPHSEMKEAMASIITLKMYDDDSICDGALLFLSRKAFKGNTEWDLSFQKAILLHEIGHIYTANNSNRCSKIELDAQKWAYNKALEMNMIQVSNIVVDITQYWKMSSKRGRYYKAYTLAKKSRFI